MPTSTFAQPNFTVDDPTTYRTKLDGNSMVGANIIDNFAVHAQATPNMTAAVDAGRLPVLGAVPAVIAAQNTATLVAPVTYPRNDIVYVDGISGAVGVAAGVGNATPVDPAIPSGKIALARLAMTVGMSSIANSIITDLRGSLLAAPVSAGVVALATSTTLTLAQSGSLCSLTGTGVTITLPTPLGNSGISYRLLGSDANTQTITSAANAIIWPDGTAANYTITNNQLIEVESDGTNWRVIGAAGKLFVEGGATGNMPGNKTQADGLYVPVRTANVTPLPAAGVGVTVTHTLGYLPTLYQFEAVCLAAEYGYSIGDVVHPFASYSNTGLVPISTWASTTQVGINTDATNPSLISAYVKNSGLPTTLTAANWAYRFVLR